MAAPVSEREKMLAGELYLAADPELVAMRASARALLRQYNASTEVCWLRKLLSYLQKGRNHKAGYSHAAPREFW